MKSIEPYKDLYVYLFSGLLGERDEIGFGGSYLGNWVEANSSFLFFPNPQWNLLPAS